ncbi:E3 ubiquitin-protein ligase TRIP12 [Rhodotorula toruloides]|uniref:HECT-type E3 ubiquitin transferase n=1 Tax=Rhodotorula toruloides TaxID=5286 RepID=A0A511KDZ3_RHOTO|nr:E3 ubiquitin-protein ligase TRIP12 [Rhodotorula toruloides]
MGRRSQRTHPTQQPPQTADTTASSSQALAATSSSKRKSVSFEHDKDEAGTTNTQQPQRRSRRTSTTSTAPGPSTTSSSSTTESAPGAGPSAKALGKRRAVSPPPAPTPAAESSSSTNNKRRKTYSASVTDAQTAEKDYNLRARPSRSTNTPASSATKNKTRTSAPARKTRSTTSTSNMPRKGTRSRAKARQRVLDEFEEEDGWEEEEEDVEMRDANVSVGEKNGKGKGAEQVGGEAGETEKEIPVKADSTAARSGDGAALVSSEHGDHDSSSSHSDTDSHPDSHDQDSFDDDDDEEIEEYETSLGLRGEERDGYGTGEEDELARSAPRTRSFGEEEGPADREGLIDEEEDEEDDAAMAEAEDALFGALAGAARGGDGADGEAGGGGGVSALSAFRALHGMMTGVATRLKGLLASLRAKDGESTAKLLALQELAELLSISTEDTLAGYFQIEAFAKELVAIVRGDSNGMGGAGGGPGGMTMEEALAFGLDPGEAGVGGDIEENDVQMMLLACRCLANLMEALPGSAHSIVYAGAVPVLCDKLKDIQYIDLAEQTLSTLEKISEEVPSSIVREGGLSALLTYIDFFSFHVQRTAVTAAANCCRNLTPDSFARVVEVMPIFKNILGYPDQRVVEQGCLAIVRIVDSYRHYPDKLEQLLSNDLLVAVKALLNPDSTTVGASTYAQMLKMLTTATKASPAVAISLVELEIANTLYHLLTGVAPPEWKTDEGKQVLDRETTAEDDMLVMQNLVQRPKEQVAEVLNLVTELLPSLPKDGIFDSRAFTPAKERKSAVVKTVVKREEQLVTVKREEETPDLNAAAGPSSTTTSRAGAASADLAADVKAEGSDDSPASALAGSSSAAAGLLSAPRLGRTSSSSTTRSGRKSRDPAKEALKAKRLELVSVEAPASRKLVFNRYVALLLPTLVDVYAATVSPQVRTRAVLGLLKMVNFCEEDHLADVLRNVPFAAFISAILSSRENPAALITNALQLVELLLVKKHDAYQYTFRREGVMHEIARIADQPLVSQKSKRSSPSRTPLNEGSVSGAAALSGLSRALQGAATKPALNPSDAQAHDSMILRARHLRDTYGAADTDPAVRAQGVLGRIKALIEHLNGVAHAEASSAKAVAKVENEAREALDEIAELFANEKNPLSSFEMIESGLVEGMLKFATEAGDGPLSPTKRQELIAMTFMPQLEGRPSTPAFAVLVKRLQESLSRIEEFEVVVAAQSGSDNDSRRGGTTMLSRQLRLRLVAEDGSDVPRSCTNLVVSIHAIATFQAFNDYLRPKILAAQMHSDRLSSGAAGGTLSSLLAAFAAAAGAAAGDDADGAILSSSPPPRRTELGGPADAAAGSSSALAKVAEASLSKLKRDEPKRRRSSRLSGKGVDPTPDAAESSTAAADQAEAKAAIERAQAQALADEEEEEAYRRGNGDLFAGRVDGASAPKDDKPVHLEVNDEGENGGKLVAKTPDGTRVATPQPAAKGSTSTASPGSAPSSKPRASYAAALKAEPTDFHLEFMMGGREIDLDTTVYGAVHRYESERPSGLGGSMWYNVYEVKFRKVAGAARPEEDDANALGDRRRREGSIFTSMPSSIPSDSQQAKILQLLHVLRSVSSEYGDFGSDGPVKQTGLSDSAFVNSKLTAKLNRQLEEPMIVASACLPDWAVDLAQSFPFLFPFDTRYTFLQSTSFGYARLMQKWVGQTRTDSNRRNDDLGMLGRLPRQKVRISRDRILESASKVFELYGSSRASLEVEFFNEVGSGLGPTLEFYALVSKEFARKSLGLWRAGDHSDTSDYVHAKTGLFPVPLADVSTDAGKKALKIFHVLGQFVAKALMDSRIIDVNFSRAFMRLVLEHDLPLNLASIKAVDPDLGKSLAHLQEYVAEKEAVEADESKTDEQRTVDLEAIQVRGATVSDLTLDFTLPGFDLELKDGGKDIAVDIHNVEEYINLVLDWTLRRGVQAQINEFKRGFSTVFPVRDLQTFTPAELVMITAAVDEDWSLETLTNATKADHGFTMDSRPVREFLAHMAGLTVEERREFLSFMTGSPRLPIGGFAALDPPLTIVRKDGGDSVLPSVMSCVNYVKLPDYSSREVLKERILLAVREGAGGFHLS